jgi:hypothetical protein
VFEEEYFYYMAHQEEINKDHLGDYVVIKGTSILGYFKGPIKALDAMAKQGQRIGTFIVHKCLPVGVPDELGLVDNPDMKVVPVWTH